MKVPVMPALEVVDCSATYGGATILRDVSMHVHAGEVVGLLGANGAGKSTTLLTISGLVRVVGGTVRLWDKPADGVPPYRLARAGLAHVPENRELVPSLSVEDNLRLGERMRPEGTPAVDVLEWFPKLRSLLKRRAGLLSGGEQQMLALARGMISRPSILLVDEMSAGLAPIIVQSLLPVLRAYANASDAAVLMVEQHAHLLLAAADRAYVLCQGQVALHGEAGALRAQPDAVEAAYFGHRQ